MIRNGEIFVEPKLQQVESSHVTDSHVTDSHVTDCHVKDSHVTDVHVTDVHVTDSHVTDSCDRRTTGFVVFDLFKGTGGGAPDASGETLRCDRSGWGV